MKRYRVTLKFERGGFNGHDYKDTFEYECTARSPAWAIRKAKTELRKFNQSGPVVEGSEEVTEL